MDLGIKGKKALVCGASKGMGLAIADRLACEGAEVIMCARDEKTLSGQAEAIQKKSGNRTDWIAGDLGDHASREKLIAEVKKRAGHLDIIVHNTGGPKPSTTVDTTLATWQDGFDRLFASVVHINSAFVPQMIDKQWGRIINITSLSVIEPIAGLAVSNGLRVAATGMLKTLADELAKFNITVNCVAPGLIKTQRTEELLDSRIKTSGQDPDEYMKEYVSSIPAGRLGTPEEFASVVAFLASEQASYVTGSTICVDGGKRRSTV